MSGTVCPHCDVVLTPRERSEGWCDSCGEKLPAFMNGSTPQREQPVTAPVAEVPARRRGFWMTFLLLLPCMTVGAGVALAVTGGKTGAGFSGIMAAVGMGLGYAFGILPNKPADSKAPAVS